MEGVSRTPPFASITDSDHGAYLLLVNVSLLIVLAFFIAAKISSSIYLKRRRTTTSSPIYVGTVVAIIQTIILQYAVKYGLGKKQDSLTAESFEKYSKYNYAAQLLHIIPVALSKLSTTLLVHILTPRRGLQKACLATIGAIGVWAVFALCAIAFQCPLPDVWLYRPDRCTTKGALMYLVAIMNILTDVAILTLPFFMMHKVQMTQGKRVKILAVLLTIGQLVTLPQSLTSSDTTWSTVAPSTFAQANMYTNLIVACLPTLYHIFAGLHSGLITTRLPDNVELSTRRKGSSYGKQTPLSAEKRRSIYTGFAFGNGDSVVTTNVRTDSRDRRLSRIPSDDSEGTSASTKQLTMESRRDGVLKTVDIHVHVEHDSD
ncbi:hypothetical protein IFM58399_06908 [Aspergillus lentulus]|uniref:uncharacterized protein n=1 Tax=Aspergillus lentulus TaxID=293939 RepID=UPI001394675E|nr:uncharacterized protein IFM58399_06908 [Aspergillus lentulus]KAF4156518.1 hypothetical protein CNMCM6069_006670 [Aspergillus lentulus]KAF4180744.1 hypothetical protein CNMCM8060_000846 [Aspergillus lentulus]KAF4189029.1 hypothetical protein CNMCM7927_009699 [Aspergillus lentulus]KAF4194302.1 hypothetical protein CNMCM8694_007793 [Aspergillus lentulus]GFF43323.1 hypothetical protein IFM58399_06908 [Aspergillus lentulus]